MVRAAVLFVALTSGCMISPIGPTVDGWAVGDPVDCTQNHECDVLIPAAVSALDRREPDHLAIVEVRLHQQGRPGAPILQTCSGGSCPVVAVFQLSDGSVRAIGVDTSLGDPWTVDYGPGLDP